MIDERGRLFGRVNLIDALVIGIVAVVIPLVYGAFVLFRVPPPVVTTVNPGQISPNQVTTVQVVGENLRPFLTAYAGTVRASEYALVSPTSARITFPPLASGTYDVALFDQLQELTRKASALVVVPAERTIATLQVKFIAAPEQIAKLSPGAIDAGRGALDPQHAVLTTIGEQRQPTPSSVEYWLLTDAGAVDRVYHVPETLLAFTGTVRVPVVRGQAGWTYKEWPVKVGGRFIFDSAAGAAIVGSIQDMRIEAGTQ